MASDKRPVITTEEDVQICGFPKEGTGAFYAHG